MEQIEGIIRILAYSHFMCIKQLEEDRLLPIESVTNIADLPFKRYDDLHILIYEKIGFEYNPKDFVPKLNLIKKDSLLEFTFQNTVTENKIAEKVQEFYGDELFALYLSIVYLCNIYAIASTAKFMNETLKDKQASGIRRTRALKFKKFALKLVNKISWILEDPIHLTKYYDATMIDNINLAYASIKEREINLNSLEELHEKMSSFIHELVPEYIPILKNQPIALKLIEELKNIKPGIQNWNKYEKYCVKVLNYLFVPEFRKVYSQVKSINGVERRDAIMPNNSKSSFWTDIKNEFNSKNIIFEFKNLVKKYSKEELNQLRIYLSKPTIGKFGFLFVRTSEFKKSLIQAQRDAYEQNGILILIIDDRLLGKMILSKAYFGSCEDIISNQKIKFELNY